MNACFVFHFYPASAIGVCLEYPSTSVWRFGVINSIPTWDGDKVRRHDITDFISML